MKKEILVPNLELIEWIKRMYNNDVLKVTTWTDALPFFQLVDKGLTTIKAHELGLHEVDYAPDKQDNGEYWLELRGLEEEKDGYYKEYIVRMTYMYKSYNFHLKKTDSALPIYEVAELRLPLNYIYY